jgi:tetratricopeptide (TPR) repeat protein
MMTLGRLLKVAAMVALRNGGNPRANRGRSSSIPTTLVVLASCLPFALGLAAQEKDKAQLFADRGMRLAQAGDLKGAEMELRRAVELAPGNPHHWADLGGILVMQQRLEEANPYFEKSLKLDPNNIVIRRNLAANQWQLGDLAEAHRNLERILKAQPGDKPTILLLGMVADNRKDYVNAAKWLGSVPQLVRQRPESIVALARSYYGTEQRLNAQETLKALQSIPTDPQGIFLGGQVAAEAADYDTAERLFTSILSAYPDRAVLGFNLAETQYRAERFRQSQQTLLDLVAAGYETSDIYNLLGWSYEKQNQLKEAVRAFDQAIDLEPSKESNYLDLGSILANSNLLTVALAVANKGLERIPSSFPLYMMKGMIETRQGYYNEAVKSYSRAVELNSQAPEANRGLAKAQLRAGLTAQAAATFETGLKRFPTDAVHYQEYALMLLKAADAGDAVAESRAVSLLESALALDSSLAEAHYQLGNRALAKGQINGALEHLEEAARREPESAKIHYALARAYRREGREKEASNELQIHERLKAEDEKSSHGPSTSEGEHK